MTAELLKLNRAWVVKLDRFRSSIIFVSELFSTFSNEFQRARNLRLRILCAFYRLKAEKNTIYQEKAKSRKKTDDSFLPTCEESIEETIGCVSCKLWTRDKCARVNHGTKVFTAIQYRCQKWIYIYIYIFFIDKSEYIVYNIIIQIRRAVIQIKEQFVSFLYSSRRIVFSK